MGGRTGQQQNSTQTTTLPGDQQQNVDLLMQGARDLYGTGGPSYYPGQTYAGTDPRTTAGRDATYNYAGGVGGALAGNAIATDRSFMDPNNIFNPENIPGFQRAQQGVITANNNNLQRNTLPAIRSGAVQNGSYGGSRQGIAEGLALSENQNNIDNTLANMNMNAYNTGMGYANAAASRAPQTYGLGLAPGQTMAGVGDAYRSDAQRSIDADMARYNFGQLAPLLNLQNFQGLTGTAGQYGGTTTGQQTNNMSGGSGALGPLGGLMSLMSMMPWGQNKPAVGGGG